MIMCSNQFNWQIIFFLVFQIQVPVFFFRQMEDQTKQSNGNEEDLSGFFFDSDDEERKQIEQSESSKSESSSLKKEDVKQDALEYWKIKANRLGNSIEAVKFN